LVLFFKKELLPSFFLAFLCAAPTLADPPAKVQQVSKAHAEGLLGQPVSDGKGNVVGHVMDVLIDDTGKPKAAVIDFAGFFGFGNRQIAVDWQALGFSPAQDHIDISIHLDADKLKSMPEYQPEATSVPVVSQAATKPH
jgi:sporulation protein YlmC with PRC-barrel domain